MSDGPIRLTSRKSSTATCTNSPQVTTRTEKTKLVLNASWRISYGKKHQAAEKHMNLNDTDTGIIKR